MNIDSSTLVLLWLTEVRPPLKVVDGAGERVISLLLSESTSESDWLLPQPARCEDGCGPGSPVPARTDPLHPLNCSNSYFASPSRVRPFFNQRRPLGAEVTFTLPESDADLSQIEWHQRVEVGGVPPPPLAPTKNPFD